MHANDLADLHEQELDILDAIDREGQSLERHLELTAVHDNIRAIEWHAERAAALAARRAARSLSAPIAQAS